MKCAFILTHYNSSGRLDTVNPSACSKTLRINAQAGNIRQTTTFKPLLGRCCLAPMEGFYEWKPDKSPVRYVRCRRELFCVAGLWANVPRPRERERVVADRVRDVGENNLLQSGPG
jgi:putative SOS response-associated peptidase YedK